MMRVTKIQPSTLELQLCGNKDEKVQTCCLDKEPAVDFQSLLDIEIQKLKEKDSSGKANT